MNVPSVILRENLPNVEDRLKLDPLDEQPKLPSPHLSAPVLPPISRPRPQNAQKVAILPNSTSVAAITHNLAHINSDSASFPRSETNQHFTE